ncbi:MAG TPA: prepilin-type N-terminal cleavage/methylation domain-containing protein [Candidatus Limnocylindrales bacterium]|nr:prepilin-type N-terminal cleavage/methylation domain-containing protein [Candidatus Limnocylindrales bacterium]
MRQSTAGFTLLEVMVAMAIVGFGVVTLLEIFSLGLRLGSRSNVHTEAVAYSARVMDELLARPKLRDGSESGTLASTNRWRAQIQTLRDATPSLNLGSNWELKEIGVEMTVPEGDQERRVELKTLRLARKGNP